MIHIAYKNDYDYAIERHDKNNKAFEEALKKFKDIKDFRAKSHKQLDPNSEWVRGIMLIYLEQIAQDME